MTEFSTPQSINQIPTNSAEAHMAKLGSEIVGENASAGWALRASDRHPNSNEDAVYAFNLANGSQLFGVFDGVGGYDAGDVASKTARQSFHESAQKGANSLSAMFGSMSDAVDRLPGNSGTTASVAMLEKNFDGTKTLTYGAVGDSPMFLFKKDGTLIPLVREETTRQGIIDKHMQNRAAGDKDALATRMEDVIAYADKYGNEITNMIGSGEYKGLTQTGSVVVEDGDQVLICSDGITGDTEAQRLSGGATNEAVIAQVLARKDLTIKQKSEELIRLARKVDDRTALIIEIGSENKTGSVEVQQTFADKIGIEDGKFRVHVPNGGIEEKGWNVTGIGTITENGQKVPAARIESVILDQKGNVLETRVTAVKVSDLLAWKEEKHQERLERIAKDYDAREASKKEAVNNARAAVESAHNNGTAPESVIRTDVLVANGFAKGQEVIISRKDGRFMRAKITGQSTSERTGEERVDVIFESLNVKTGEIELLKKPFDPEELKQLQQDYKDGKIKTITGTGIVLPPQ